MEGFIKDISILQENSNVDDLLDLSQEIEIFLNKIEEYNDKSMIALKGRFGVGKSTFLYQIEKKIKSDKKLKWIEFDAWKYPDRSNLWESFVLELAKKIDEDKFDKTIRKINGKTTTPWVEKLINFSAGLVGSIRNFNDFLNTSPAKRTFEIQAILTDLINILEQDTLYIIIEDIDRSGDKGIYFLETLNYFIKNSELNKELKIIVPISNSSYVDKKVAYHKCFDYINDYENPEYQLDNFCKTIFIDDITGKKPGGTYIPTNQYNIILDFLEGLFKFYNDAFTLRELKMILRNANEKYKSLMRIQGDDINFMICIIVEASKIIIDGEGKSIFEKWKSGNSIPRNNDIFNALFNNLNESHSTTIYKDHRKEKLNYVLPHPLKIKKLSQSDYDAKLDILFHNGKSGFNDGPSYLYIGDLYFRE